MAEPTEYAKYIRTDALLALQKAPEALACHDELAFQIVHQVEELWMKLAEHELDHAAALIDGDRLCEASTTLGRMRLLVELMADQLRVLESMSPRAYFTVRAQLGRGSGQESPGFNRLKVAPEALRVSLDGLLQRRGIDLLALHREPTLAPELFALTEALLDLDDAFQTFRYRHLALVRRIIGGRTPSLKGAPAELLERGVKACFFPALWRVREALFRDFVPGPPLFESD